MKLTARKLKEGKYLSIQPRVKNPRQMKFRLQNIMFSHLYQSSCSSSFDGTQIYSFCVLDCCNRSPGLPHREVCHHRAPLPHPHHHRGQGDGGGHQEAQGGQEGEPHQSESVGLWKVDL